MTRKTGRTQDAATDEHVGDIEEAQPDEFAAPGDGPLSEELPGRAGQTNEDLTSLMANRTQEHLEDGFRAGNGDDPETDSDEDAAEDGNALRDEIARRE